MDICNIQLNSWLEQNENECLQQVHENWNKIPLLNVLQMHDVHERKLVRFRGMIQDMFNPEYYYETFEVTNKITKETNLRHGKYQDSVGCDNKEFINFDSTKNVTKERQTFVVLTPPGLNEWAVKLEQELYKPKYITGLLTSGATKRALDEETSSNTLEHETTSMMEVESTESTNKKQCTVRENAITKPAVVSHEHLLNMPLPGGSGKACHLKIYQNGDTLKLNEMIDCVGFLSMDAFYQEPESHDDEVTDEGAMELQTHNPPTSLIPKIHCVAFKHVTHSNPLIEMNNNMELDEIQAARNELEVVLTQLLLGDKFAAEYLIYHLISKVYSRQDVMALGKFTLNISNVPTPVLPEYGRMIYEILEQMLPKSHYLPMSLENMNELAFIPKKDYDCNRITSGVLQLSNNTHLVLDETKLTAGKLNEAGVRAVGAISSVIKHQRCYYDFNFYQMEFDCDIPFLILSEGKSLLPTDCHIVLKPEDDCITTFEDIIEAVKVFLKPELLNSIRKYLTNRRHAEYEISDDINELVQNEFVDMRTNYNATADDLHNLLVLARFVCLAEGKRVLDEACWKQACQLERERRQRLQK